MAAEIGVSPSYLNHLERNQRPVTAGVLLRLAEAYDVDLRSFAAERRRGHRASTSSPRSSPTRCSAASRVPRYELVEMADNAPGVADALSRLYAALVELRRRPADADADGERGRWSRPQNWVRDHIQAQRNHFPELEEAAETLAGALGDPLSIAEPLRRRLKEGYGHRGADRAARLSSTAASQHYDLHRKRLMLSALLRARKPHLRARLPARPDRVPADVLAQMVDAARAARRADRRAAPHEPRQLCGRRRS